MGDRKCCTKFAPIACRKDEDQRLNPNIDAPASTSLRSKDKDVQASRNEPTGVTGSKNQTDKQSRYLAHQPDKGNHSEVNKSKVHTSSSVRKTSRLSTDAKKISDSSLPPCRSRQFSRGPNNSNETKSPSKNECKKKQLANKRDAQAKSETSNASSPSQVWPEKKKSTRPSEDLAKQSIEKSTRSLGEPAKQSVEESTRSPYFILCSKVKKSEVHTSSSARKISQPSTDAKNINYSTLQTCRSRQLSKGPNNNKETKSPSKNERKEKQLAHKRAAQAKSETSNASSLSQVGREKKKSTRPSEEPHEQSTMEAHICYIRLEGFGEATEPVGWTCGFCEKDLGVSPFKEEVEPTLPSYGDYFFHREEEQQENVLLLPEVSVFPCGHAFHSLCLQQVQFEEQLSNAPCLFCLSLS